jgi:hypothetical protein
MSLRFSLVILCAATVARAQAPEAVIPPPALPAAPAEPPLSYGSVVRQQVALYPHVRVKDADDVAPGALPIVVAVRDPNCAHPKAAGVVFVKVCVPIGAPCKVRVNKRGTELELDYGEYEIEIRSERGVVTIDYDD